MTDDDQPIDRDDDVGDLSADGGGQRSKGAPDEFDRAEQGGDVLGPTGDDEPGADRLRDGGNRALEYDDEGGLFGSGTDSTLELLDEPGEVHDHPEAKGRMPVAAIALVVALLLGAVGAAVYVLARESSNDAGVELDEAGRPTETVPPEVLEERTLDEVVEELQAFVEAERGLEFIEPVDVTLLDDEAFKARLLSDLEEDREEIDADTAALRALELIGPDVDLYEAFTALLAVGVVGFYDPETDELVVRGDDLTPYVRQVLVHELVHALQDQHFELDRPELEDRDDEAYPAFSGLVEGDAVRVDNAYRDTLSEEERRAAQREELSAATGLDLAAIPRVLPAFVAFPYVSGPTFVEGILAEGGQERLDRAFAEPPSTTEHILHPERFLRGENRIEVRPPAADGDVIDEGVFGAYALAVLLGDGSPTADTLNAVDGWGGDWYVVWRQGQRSCLRVTVVGDGPESFGPLAAALDDWADRHDADYEVVAGEVTLTSCA